MKQTETSSSLAVETPGSPSLVIVTDRGRFLAYSIDRSSHTPVPRLIESMDFVEGHMRLGEQVTDRAGSFPVTGSGGQANSAAERMTLVSELEMRSFRRVVERICAVLHEHRPESWAFAAPSEINGAILDGLPPAMKNRMDVNVKKDLVRVPPTELMSHLPDENH